MKLTEYIAKEATAEAADMLMECTKIALKIKRLEAEMVSIQLKADFYKQRARMKIRELKEELQQQTKKDS